MKNQIKRISVRRYSDNETTAAYVEWSNGSRTEGQPHLSANHRRIATYHFGAHMHALFQRAKREGLKMQRESW